MKSSTLLLLGGLGLLVFAISRKKQGEQPNDFVGGGSIAPFPNQSSATTPPTSTTLSDAQLRQVGTFIDYPNKEALAAELRNLAAERYALQVMAQGGTAQVAGFWRESGEVVDGRVLTERQFFPQLPNIVDQNAWNKMQGIDERIRQIKTVLGTNL